MALDAARIESDKDYRDEMRHRCVSDHFFLAGLMGKDFAGFNPRIHQPVVDLYFPKNPNIPIQDQHPIKNRLHIDPRTTGKTTMGRVDSLQWILAFPEDITILNETATKPLAEQISQSLSQFLWKRKDRPPTDIQRLFPELTVEKEPGPVWDTPLRTPGGLDHTLAYTSPQTSQSGWHPWVECIDDMVDTKNSGMNASDDLRRSVIDTYYTNKNVLLHGGYINLRGTRYHPFELHGELIEKMNPEEWKVLIRSALRVKSGRRLLPGEFPEEDEVILNFPEWPGMDYRTLRRKFLDNYESFMCQQQNDPQGGHVPTFDEELYKTMLISPERIPGLGDTFLCWRLPYGGKPYMTQYAEGAAARVWEGRVYVLDAWQGTYTPSRLAQKLINEARAHDTGILLMEALPGTEYIEGHIRNEAMRRNLSLRIQWLEFEEDDNRRFERIKQLEPQARAGRILISTASSKAGEMHSQFVNFGLKLENGIVDCVSQLAAKVPISLWREEIEEDERDLQLRRRHEMMSHFVYGMNGGQTELEERKAKEEAAHAAAMQSLDNIGLTDILGGLDG